MVTAFSRTPAASLGRRLAVSAQSLGGGIEVMGETDTQLGKWGGSIYVGKDKIDNLFLREDWRWKWGWTERAQSGAALARIWPGRWQGGEEVSGVILAGEGSRGQAQPDWLCSQSVVFSAVLGNFSPSKSWNWFHFYFAAECGSLNPNVCAEAKPRRLWLYLGFATKAKGCITLGPFLSLFSWPCPVSLPHRKVLLVSSRS